MKDKGFINYFAKVLCDLARRNDLLEQIEDELKIAINLVSDKRLKRIIHHPKILLKEKEDLLYKALSPYGISKLTISFLGLLLKDERLDYLKEISLRYEKLVDNILNRKKVIVTTAIPLEEEERRHLIETLERLTGGKIKLEEYIDERILGGVVVRIGDRLIDGSIRSALYRLREEMVK